MGNSQSYSGQQAEGGSVRDTQRSLDYYELLGIDEDAGEAEIKV